MKNRLCMLIVLSIIFILLCKESYTDKFSENKVLTEINDKQFDELMEMEGITFIMFYAPWCPHCTNLIGTWDELCHRKNSNKFRMARINADYYSNIGKSHNVRSYPSLKIYKNGNFVQDYQGQRNIKSMEEFINNYI